MRLVFVVLLWWVVWCSVTAMSEEGLSKVVDNITVREIFFLFSGTSFQWLSCMSVWMPALKKASRKSTDPCLEISGLGFWTALRLCQKRFEEAFISVFCFVSKCCDYISGAVLVVLYMKTNSPDQFESHLEEIAVVPICVLFYVSLLRQTHWITFEVIVNIRSVLWLDVSIGASSVSSVVAFLSFGTIELFFHVTGNNIYIKAVL